MDSSLIELASKDNMTSSAEPYLMRLAQRLTTGLSGLQPERRERHQRFIRSKQQHDGGFGGRDGDSDLYYTSFAVRGLAMLGGLTPEECGSVGGFLKRFDWQKLGVIDLINWLYSVLAVQAFGGADLLEGAAADWPEQMASRLEALRRKDGGYAKSPEGAASSTYHTFLVTLTYELLGKQPPQIKSLIQFIYDRQRDDGGFVEIGQMKNSGTNPTAAAIGVLSIIGGIDDELRSDVGDFLKNVWTAEGGFQANTRIPFPDALSTFTGLLTVQDLKITNLVSERAIERLLVEWLEFPTGGFRAASWDAEADVEYTFYGLGCLALLWSAREGQSS